MNKTLKRALSKYMVLKANKKAYKSLNFIHMKNVECRTNNFLQNHLLLTIRHVMSRLLCVPVHRCDIIMIEADKMNKLDLKHVDRVVIKDLKCL